MIAKTLTVIRPTTPATARAPDSLNSRAPALAPFRRQVSPAQAPHKDQHTAHAGLRGTATMQALTEALSLRSGQPLRSAPRASSARLATLPCTRCTGREGPRGSAAATRRRRRRRRLGLRCRSTDPACTLGLNSTPQPSPACLLTPRRRAAQPATRCNAAPAPAGGDRPERGDAVVPKAVAAPPAPTEAAPAARKAVKFAPMDGNEAVSRIAYACSDVSFIYPITPATPMGEHVDVWAAQGRKNLFGNVMQVGAGRVREGLRSGHVGAGGNGRRGAAPRARRAAILPDSAFSARAPPRAFPAPCLALPRNACTPRCPPRCPNTMRSPPPTLHPGR